MEITTKSFQNEVIDSDIPVMIECWASWCLPCKQIEPILDKLKEKYEGKCKVLKINIDKNPKISRRYAIKGLPSFITFVNRKEFERRVGAQTDEQLINMIKRAINEFENLKKKNEEDALDEREQKIIEERLKNLDYM
ncbi:hypothetical protein ES705_08623 [subsurface metagenome]